MTERVPCPACVTVDPVSAYGLPRETPPTYLFACPECKAAPGVSCVDEVGTRTLMAPWYRHRAEPHDAVLKRARPKERPEYYVELVRPVVGDLSFLLSDLPEDFAFPWDNVEIATPKAKLLRFYRTMRKRMARLNCAS